MDELEVPEEKKDDFYNDDLSTFDDFTGDGYSPMEKHNDLLKELTDFESHLKQMRKNWLGLKWDDKLRKYKRDPTKNAKMNINGVEWCLSFIRTYERKTNIITSLDGDTYNNMMEDINTTALINIGTRAEEFGIKSNGDIMLISNQVIHGATLALVGASENKNYKDLLQATVQRTENINPVQSAAQQQNLSWVSKMANMFRRR